MISAGVSIRGTGAAIIDITYWRGGFADAPAMNSDGVMPNSFLNTFVK